MVLKVKLVLLFVLSMAFFLSCGDYESAEFFTEAEIEAIKAGDSSSSGVSETRCKDSQNRDLYCNWGTGCFAIDPTYADPPGGTCSSHIEDCQRYGALYINVLEGGAGIKCSNDGGTQIALCNGVFYDPATESCGPHGLYYTVGACDIGYSYEYDSYLCGEYMSTNWDQSKTQGDCAISGGLWKSSCLPSDDNLYDNENHMIAYYYDNKPYSSNRDANIVGACYVGYVGGHYRCGEYMNNLWTQNTAQEDCASDSYSWIRACPLESLYNTQAYYINHYFYDIPPSFTITILNNCVSGLNECSSNITEVFTLDYAGETVFSDNVNIAPYRNSDVNIPANSYKVCITDDTDKDYCSEDPVEEGKIYYYYGSGLK
jgi:hypothetical protein